MEWPLSAILIPTKQFFGRLVSLLLLILLLISIPYDSDSNWVDGNLQLDKQEDQWRRRRRLIRNYNGTTHPEATIGTRPMSPSIEAQSPTVGVDLSLAATAVKFAAHVDQFDALQTDVEVEDTCQNNPSHSKKKKTNKK